MSTQHLKSEITEQHLRFKQKLLHHDQHAKETADFRVQ